MSTAEGPRTIPTGEFRDPDEAARAIERLLGAGFTADQISVVTGPEHAERFRRYISQKPAGARTGRALTRGGTVGLLLAVIIVGIALFRGGEFSLAKLGIFMGLAIVATFGAVMMTRGGEGALADYHDQAVEADRVLVAVKVQRDISTERLAEAGRILSRSADSQVDLPPEV